MEGGESGEDTTSSGGNASSGAAEGSSRWTCEACGCHTNTESDTSCSICGTSRSGGSFLRRASHARAAWMARGLFSRGGGRSGNNNGENPDDALLDEEADLWDTVVREVEIEREAIGRSLEGWPEALGGSSISTARQRYLEGRVAARDSAGSNESGTASSTGAAATLSMSPDELWNAALERNYSPNWNGAASSAATSASSCIEVISPHICTVSDGGGEGQAIRAEPSIAREFSNSNRIYGFKVVFDHPTSVQGHSMGGCYLVGVTTSSFTAYNESNALSQSPFFWGIEDGGSKYEGPRHARRGARRQNPSYATELGSSVSRNAHGVLFGARDVVSVICDMNTRTMCFWRNETCLGPLVQGLPRSGSLYPVVVPFNARVSTAIGPLSQDLLPVLSQFSAEYRLQKVTEERETRKRIKAERTLLLGDDSLLTGRLVDTLKDIWKSYQDVGDHSQDIAPLSRQAAARLWYRCGMSLASLERIFGGKKAVEFDDFRDVLQKVLIDDHPIDDVDKPPPAEKGDRVQLVKGYEKFGDAAGGPLRPGDRGVVVELQGSPSGENRSIRVYFNGRRWWYQPQALLSEKSGLIETAGVWFARKLLRAHGFDPVTLKSLEGHSLTGVTPVADDLVTLASVESWETQSGNPVEAVVGRVVVDQTSVGEQDVLVESIHPDLSSGADSKKESSRDKVTLTTRSIAKNSLVYTSVLRGSGNKGNAESEDMKVDGSISDGIIGEDGESVTAKIYSDLAGIARLDGSSLDSVAKECKKNSEALASVFSAGLPSALLRATETAERQMQSLETREDLPERISAVGSLVLYIAEHLFAENPVVQVQGDINNNSERPASPEMPFGLRRRRAGASYRTSRRARSAAAAAAAAALDEAEQQGSTIADALHHRRGLLVSLISRGSGSNSGDVAGMDEALGPAAEDIFFSRLPPGLSSGAGDRASLLSSGRNLFEAGSSTRSNSTLGRSTRGRNSGPHQPPVPPVASGNPLGNQSRSKFLDTILRSSTAPARSVVASNTAFFQHVIRVGVWWNSPGWIKAALDRHIKKSPQKLSAVLKQAYDEEGTPIMKLAVMFGCSPSVVGLLLACGAQVNASEVRAAVATNQSEVLGLLLRHMSLPSDIDVSDCSEEIKAVVEEARQRQDRLDRKMRESAGQFMVDMLKRLVNLGLISRRHRTARLESCSRSLSEILVGNVLLRVLQQSQKSRKSEVGTDPNVETATGRFTVEDRLLSHPACGLFGTLPESILGDALFGSAALATNTLLLLEDFLCCKDMVDSSAGLTALLSLLTKFPSLRSCSELRRYGMLDLVSFHHTLASGRYSEGQDPNLPTVEDGGNCGGSGLVFCPKKHTAVLHITRHSSFRCDLCGNGVDRGRVMHGCRECDWDACEECTDKAESGIVKSAAIRDVADSCRKLLENYSEEAFSKVPTSTEATYLRVISDIGGNTARMDVDNVASRLLQYDRKAIRDLASMLRTPGGITVHQFKTLVLPALHAACAGKVQVRDSKKGHKSKKAKVASQGEGGHTRNPEERTGFCMELVRAMILDVDGSPKKRETHRTPLSEAISTNDSEDGEEASGESESESRQIVNEREIGFFAEASELLRRLQQVLSLYENVRIGTVDAKKRPNGDLQSLTKAIELHLRPSTLHEKNPGVPDKLILHAEPLVALDDIKRHALRCCGMVDHSYKEYCRRLVSDRAIIFERPFGSQNSWSIAQVTGFDEFSGVHTLRYGLSLRRGQEGFVFGDENTFDFGALLSFDRDEKRIVLAVRQYYIVQRANNGKKASTRDSSNAGVETRAPEIGTRVQSSEGGNEMYTIVACNKMNDKEVFTLVSDDGAATTVKVDDMRRVGSANPDSDQAGVRARWISREERRTTANSESLTRVFPFLLGRQRSESDTAEGSRENGLAIKRSFSALSLAESLRPTDLVASQIPTNSTKLGDKSFMFEVNLSGEKHTLRFKEGGVEAMPHIDVTFSAGDKLAGIEFSRPDTTLISAISKLYSNNGVPTGSSACGPVVLYFSISSNVDEHLAKERGGPLAKMSAVSLPVAPLSSGSMEIDTAMAWSPQIPDRTRKVSGRSVTSEDQDYSFVCDGLDSVCLKCMEVISVLSEFIGESRILRDRERTGSVFSNHSLSKKLKDQLDDTLSVVGGALPGWCTRAPSFAPRVFSYDSRRALLERAAFGVSRGIFKQQEAKVNVGRLRQRMASLRARAVELVGEAFSGGADDPTALQLQADELYGMEEALANRVRTAFRAVKWKEHALEVAKAVIRREELLADADRIMSRYAQDEKVNRRRLEVRFDGESGFDAASGDEAGVTRGFYADVAEALLSSDLVSNLYCPETCTPAQTTNSAKAQSMDIEDTQKPVATIPLWIPDMDSSGQVVLPTPRADERSGLGVYPRPLPKYHPQMEDVLEKFRFMGRLFAAAVRDGFMFPLPLSASFLKLVQHGESDAMLGDSWEELMDMSDLPRPGFLGGEIYAAEIHVCRALDHLDASDPPLSRHELQRKYDEVARDQKFARVALGKAYECSFEDYFQDRTFVDPLDPAQDENAHPLCPKGHQTPVTVYNVRKWIALSKKFFLYGGVISQAMAFREGIEDFFPVDYLRLFTAEELQRDVCGSGDNVENWDEAAVRKLFKLDGGKDAAEALVAVAAMGGEGSAALSRRFGPSSPTITNLVKALLEASPQQRRHFLSFVTSVPIVTPGRIEVVPIVSPSGDFLPMHDPTVLPRANTCARRLYLPKFTEYDEFRSVLFSVIQAESHFKGFHEWKG